MPSADIGIMLAMQIWLIPTAYFLWSVVLLTVNSVVWDHSHPYRRLVLRLRKKDSMLITASFWFWSAWALLNMFVYGGITG